MKRGLKTGLAECSIFCRLRLRETVLSQKLGKKMFWLLARNELILVAFSSTDWPPKFKASEMFIQLKENVLHARKIKKRFLLFVVYVQL